jgi:hypothetical protein
MNDVRIPIDEFTVAGNSSTVARIICEKGPFRMRGMLLTCAETTRYLMIDDIKVGRNSQFYCCSAVPASFFDREDRQEGLYFDVLPRGQYLTVCVTNASPEPKPFGGVVYGDLADDYQSPRPHHLQLRSPDDRFCLGSGRVAVPPKSRLTVQMQSQIVFRPDCLVVPEHVLEGVRVTMVRAVGEILWTKTEKIETELAKFRFPPVMQVADWLCVDVENETSDPQFFSGTIAGTSP